VSTGELGQMSFCKELKHLSGGTSAIDRPLGGEWQVTMEQLVTVNSTGEVENRLSGN
jgi:hypothetical protein